MNQRLVQFRKLLEQNQLLAGLVRSTDAYLNEYVSAEKSRRAYVTGFTGSAGDALVSADRAILFVDGRYEIQAAQEAIDFEVRVIPLGSSIESAWQKELRSWGEGRVGLETDRMSVTLFDQLKGIDWIELPDFGPSVGGDSEGERWSIPESIFGESTLQKLKRAESFFQDNPIDAFLIGPLDEIAWLSNQRAFEFPYQAVFSARALAYPDRLDWVSKPMFFRQGTRIGLDPDLTPESVRRELEQAGARVVFLKSPFQAMKSVKNPAELNHIRSAIARADRVVDETQRWISEQMEHGAALSENDVDQHVRERYKKSGATGLSFKPICAAAKNAAQVHYGVPSQNEKLNAGDLFLLDTGAYYEGGYATDLTRTFLLGGRSQLATELQKKIFTTVLKAAIAGMTARFPIGTTGAQLDALVRDPIWREGYTYPHGTGHGIGVNVHEAPPRISPASSFPMEENQVFSIEPGVYIEGFGGVRIENLCTVIRDSERSGFLKVIPLSFCPLDDRLIDTGLLTSSEMTFLTHYQSKFPVLL
ncbi:MAG: M24 family metallopeptidase [Myxococcaceae bacterium]|nr:M24 family metallopeptidase [Myxococcaceae bacterium]MBH2006901.1 M24 family metallopeptidase [Myxococcaceae bacterium]